ncbi:MAG: fumarylacetoacetate hydrolase family protein, partial [Bacteroidota bacterium]
MQLVMFQYQGRSRLGARRCRAGTDYIIDLNRADPSLAADILLLLRAGASALEQAREASASAEPDCWIPSGECRLLAPISRPGKILCLGHNYQGHLGQDRVEPPAFPEVFCKTGNTVIGPGQPVVIPPMTGQVDYEAELLVVIGKTARRISESDAPGFVAGYTIFNDISARDIQKRTSQWLLGKSFDTFGPMGPALVTADEVPDPHGLALELTVNGVAKQQANTREMIFQVPFLVSYLSQVMTLEPGDVNATATPARITEAAEPRIYLKSGDLDRISIEKLGSLEKPIEAAPAE